MRAWVGYVVALAAVVLIVLAFALVQLKAEEEGVKVVEVVEVKGPILDENKTDCIVKLLSYAGRNPDVRGVVLLVNSPGGYATYVERIYAQAVSLNKTVLTYVDGIALSGGYYIAVAGREIYSVPSGYVGSIGVITIIPPRVKYIGYVIESGPYKIVGFGDLDYYNASNTVLRNFLRAVVKGRGDRLKVNTSYLTSARVFTVVDGTKIGLVDGISSLDGVVKRVAEIEGLGKFVVRRASCEASSGEAERTWWNLSADYLFSRNPPPYIYLMYIPSLRHPSNRSSLQQVNNTGAPPPGVKYVILDVTHSNYVEADHIEYLTSLLSKRGIAMVIAFDWDEVVRLINNSLAYIVINPWRPYSDKEARTVLNSSAKILFMFDPQLSLSWIMNTLSTYFNITFIDRQLYNTERNYLNVHNLYVEFNGSCPSSLLLAKGVVFGASPLVAKRAVCEGRAKGAVLGYGEGEYDVVVFTRRAVAVGDSNMFKPYFVEVEDNRRIVEAIVNFLASGKGSSPSSLP